LTQRILSILWMLMLLELGALLLFLPWVNIWEANYFLNQYPALRPVLLHPSFRGAVSGLGALDILVAISMVRRPRIDAPTDQPASPQANRA
jgi:hypothetical protein